MAMEKSDQFTLYKTILIQVKHKSRYQKIEHSYSGVFNQGWVKVDQKTNEVYAIHLTTQWSHLNLKISGLLWGVFGGHAGGKVDIPSSTF